MRASLYKWLKNATEGHIRSVVRTFDVPDTARQPRPHNLLHACFFHSLRVWWEELLNGAQFSTPRCPHVPTPGVAWASRQTTPSNPPLSA